jgi:hypothetical protein
MFFSSGGCSSQVLEEMFALLFVVEKLGRPILQTSKFRQLAA